MRAVVQRVQRASVDVDGATAFSTALILSGLKGLPQAQPKPAGPR